MYLNFDGVTLSPGADDAANNTTRLLMAPRTFPRFLDGVNDRDQRIAAITARVQAVLAPYDVLVTRERPASGPYRMQVFTGPSMDDGFSFQTNGLVPYACSPTEQPNLVGLQFLVASAETGSVASSADFRAQSVLSSSASRSGSRRRRFRTTACAGSPRRATRTTARRARSEARAPPPMTWR